MEKKLNVGDIIKNGFSIGMKNALAIIVNCILYGLTMWIPYLNVGTTIGLSVGVIAKAGKGETIPMTEIFDAKYRKFMGEFFLTSGFVAMGVVMASVLLVIPGIVLGIAWSQAVLLAVDKGVNATEAISMSNKVTYGNKGSMFLAFFVVVIGVSILSLIFSKIPVLGIVLSIALVFVYFFTIIGMRAYIYNTLCGSK